MYRLRKLYEKRDEMTGSPSYYPHPLNFRAQTAAQVMIATESNGIKYYGILHVILETLGMNGGEIQCNEISFKSLALSCGIRHKNLEDAIQVLSKYDLIVVNDKCITSDLYDKFIASYNESKERRSEAGRQNVAKRWASKAANEETERKARTIKPAKNGKEQGRTAPE